MSVARQVSVVVETEGRLAELKNVSKWKRENLETWMKRGDVWEEEVVPSHG